MNPVMSESEINNKVEEFVKLLETSKAEIIYKSPAKPRKLAYPIQKKQTGVYQVIEFKAPSNTIELLERTFRLDSQIMRFLTIALDKHGVEYNLKKKKSAFPESFISKSPSASKEDEKPRKNENDEKEGGSSKNTAEGVSKKVKKAAPVKNKLGEDELEVELEDVELEDVELEGVELEGDESEGKVNEANSDNNIKTKK